MLEEELTSFAVSGAYDGISLVCASGRVIEVRK